MRHRSPRHLVRDMRNIAGLNNAGHKGQPSLPGQPTAKESAGAFLIEVRLSEHSKLPFSHGICPDCIDQYVNPERLMSKHLGAVP